MRSRPLMILVAYCTVLPSSSSADQGEVGRAPGAVKCRAGHFAPKLDADHVAGPTRPRALADKAFAKLKESIASIKDAELNNPDSVFRLAEHYRSLHRQRRINVQTLEEQIRNTRSSETRAALARSLQPARTHAEHWLVEAIEKYLKIVRNKRWSNYDRTDAVLYALVDLLLQAKRDDKARQHHAMLTKEYPRSLYVPYANASFGDYHLALRQITTALKAYERVGARFQSSPIYAYSLYRQGWCWLRLAFTVQAVGCFLKAIRASKQDPVLEAECRRSLVIAYSEAGAPAPNKASAFFKQFGREAVPMMQQLAEMYRRSGRPADATAVERSGGSLGGDADAPGGPSIRPHLQRP